MDFGSILHIAKKNSENNKNDGRYYSTKFAPPKKESKEKKLSENIQKFLKKKEEEERRQKIEKMRNASNLMNMRDEKSKNKIRKMLKVTKSANKSVLEDAASASASAGGRRPEVEESADMDDYGYTSSTANTFFQKYIEKVKDVKDDKGFAPSRPQSIKDLKGTTERVKAAIMREREEKESGSRQSRVQSSSIDSSSSPHVRKSSRPLYDPEAERLEEERKRKEAERERAKQARKPAPPPMDFQALLKLAEKKQHEPLPINPVEIKKKEPERLLTMKEKKEMEERQRLKEERERRQKEASNPNQKTTANRDSNANSIPRIPKIGQSAKPNKPSAAINEKSFKSEAPTRSDIKSKSDAVRKGISTSSVKPTKPSASGSASSSSNSSSSAIDRSKPIPKSLPSAKASTSSSSLPKTSLSREAPVSSKGPSNSKITAARQFPPSDLKRFEAKKNAAPIPQKTRQFPPPDVMRSNKPKKPQAHKRRILDDDEDEYDSEMDDFIEDGDEEEDYSSHIKSIFGYDKNKYRDWDDDDDAGMESNFAQVQREEFISKKIGIQEDLEDMRLEAIMKKRKIDAKKRKK